MARRHGAPVPQAPPLHCLPLIDRMAPRTRRQGAGAHAAATWAAPAFADVPIDVLQHILGFLNVPDRCAAAWRRGSVLCLCPPLAPVAVVAPLRLWARNPPHAACLPRLPFPGSVPRWCAGVGTTACTAGSCAGMCRWAAITAPGHLAAPLTRSLAGCGGTASTCARFS